MIACGNIYTAYILPAHGHQVKDASPGPPPTGNFLISIEIYSFYLLKYFLYKLQLTGAGLATPFNTATKRQRDEATT